MVRSKEKNATVNYGDHEVITPENGLRGAVSKQPPGETHDDPVARAEKALAELSSEFGSWMDSECDRLDKARRAFAKDFTRSNADALFVPRTISRAKRRHSAIRPSLSRPKAFAD